MHAVNERVVLADSRHHAAYHASEECVVNVEGPTHLHQVFSCNDDTKNPVERVQYINTFIPF